MLTPLAETFSDQSLSSGDSQPLTVSTNPPATTMPELATVKDHRVITVASTMAKNLKHHPRIEELANSVNLSINQLELLFREEFNCCPTQYISHLRMEKACFLLANTELRVCQIMRQVGFSQPGYFSATFRIALGCTPKEFRRKSHFVQTVLNSQHRGEMLT